MNIFELEQNSEINDWLNQSVMSQSNLNLYQASLIASSPNHIVFDGLFNQVLLDQVMDDLQGSLRWLKQRHTYAELYVTEKQWQNTQEANQFVQRDVWQRPRDDISGGDIASQFLEFLRSEEFLMFLSTIFNVQLTDKNVGDVQINTNYFRLGADDFVRQHADDSPSREVCLLLYMNEGLEASAGGELCFNEQYKGRPIEISPSHNRCVLFNPSSTGAEHWVKPLKNMVSGKFRYNVTSWYWSE